MFLWNMVGALILMPFFSAGGYLQSYAEELDEISQLLRELAIPTLRPGYSGDRDL